MTGYDLMARLRKRRLQVPITATAQALYYELVALCNESEWSALFVAKNKDLSTALGITDKTFSAARQCLVDAGLISFISETGRSARCQYRFPLLIKSVKNPEFKEQVETGNIGDSPELPNQNGLNSGDSPAFAEINNGEFPELPPETPENFPPLEINTGVKTVVNTGKFPVHKLLNYKTKTKTSESNTHSRTSELGEGGWSPVHDQIPDPPANILQAICEAQHMTGNPGLSHEDVSAYWTSWKVPEFQGDRFYPSLADVYRRFANHCRFKRLPKASKQKSSYIPNPEKDIW